MATSREIFDNYTAPETLEENVKLFFEILDTIEISDNGKSFRPNYISSCRVWDNHRLDCLLKKMKQLINN